MSLDITLLKDDSNVFEYNITHNLNTMADKAEIYNCLWRPDENGFYYAKDIISNLSNGYIRLIADPIYYKRFNPENGWGNYEGLVKLVKEYLMACIEYPDALIHISR